VPGRTYSLKVVAAGSRIQVFLDGDTTSVIDVCDGTYAGGRFGVNVFDAVGEAQDLTLS
jgi:fructan beta-fructosidase